jgi:hypothetical protein
VGACVYREAGIAVLDKRAIDDLELRVLGDFAADACAARHFAATDESGCPFEHDAGALSAGELPAHELEDARAHNDAHRRVLAELAVGARELPAVLRDAPSGGRRRNRTRATRPSGAAIAEMAAPSWPLLLVILNQPCATLSALCVQSW